MDSGTSINDYPLGFDVYVSNDDVSYGVIIASGAGTTTLFSLAFATQTARYIKIVLNHTSGFWWSISELNVYGSAGGTQLTRTSWAATASLTDTTNVASNALDNVTSTYWRTGANQSAPQWLKLDMQSAQTFTQVSIDATGDANDYPHGYAIYAYNTDDGLHDGSAIAVGTGAATIVTATFSAQTARYLKIVQTAAFSTQWWSVHEVNILNGGSTLSRAGWVASASLSTGTAANAIDGAIGTRWSTGTGQAVTQWLKVDMQQAQTFSQLRLDDGSRTGEYPSTFAVYAYSNDDGLHDGNPVYAGTSATDVTDLTFSTQTARYLKILITGAAGSNWSVAELGVYGTPVGSAIQSSVTVAGLVLSNAVTITQSAGVTVTVTGPYAQSAGAFVGSNGAVALQNTFALTGGTFTAGGGAVTATGAATLGGGATLNAGSSTWSFGSTLAIGSGSAGTFNANSAAVTFTGAVSLLNGGVFNGNTGSGTFSAVPTLTNGTFSVGDAASAGRWTFSLAATFTSGTTLAFPTTGGELSMKNGNTLTLAGTVTSSGGLVTTRPLVDCNGCSTNQGFTVTVSPTAVLNINGLQFDHVAATGVQMSDGVTYTSFRNVKFTNNAAGGTSSGTHLSITSANATGNKLLVIPGAYFDSTAQYNVTLSGTGSGAGSGIRAIFENSGSDGPRAGDSFDLDADTNHDNVADTNATPRWGSIVEWVTAAPSDTTGSATGVPTPAFDWNTFANYGVYAAYKDANGTADRIWLRNADGTPDYFYDIPQASNGDIVGTPKWDTESEIVLGTDVNANGVSTDTDVHVLYVATSLGRIIKLIDNGASLAPPASGAWSSPFSNVAVTSITSPLSDDFTNLYFGGSGTSVFGVQITGGVNEAKLVKTIGSLGTVSAALSYSIVGGDTYLLAGSTANIYRIDTLTAMVDRTFAVATPVNGSLRLVNGHAYGVTDGGTVHAINAFAGGSGTFVNITGFPYQSVAASPIKSAAWIDSNNVYFGDNAGNLYVVTSAGGNLAGYPSTVVGGAAISSSPLYLAGSGVIAVGGADGSVYFVNRHNASNVATLIKKYFVGNLTVSSVAYNSSTSEYMVSTADGRMAFIKASDVPDPDSTE